MDYRRTYGAVGVGGIALVSLILLTVHLKTSSTAQNVSNIVGGYKGCVTASKEKPQVGACLRKLAKGIMARYPVGDLDTALGTMTDPKDLNWCHEFMHYAGWELYDKKGNFPDAFADASGKCDSGMMHGVVEEYISKTAPGYDVPHFVQRVAPTTCGTGPGENMSSQSAQAICYHGLGHAFMFLTDNALSTSLGYCDDLSEDFRQACYAGVYMEEMQEKQVGRSNVGHESLFAAYPSDPDYPCDTLQRVYKSECYRFLGVESFLKSPTDTKRAFSSCLRVDTAYRNDCFWGIGNDFPSPSTDVRTAALACEAALEVSEEAYQQCVMGGITFVIQMDRGKAEQAAVYCEAIRDPYKDTCYRAAGNNLRNWTNSQAELIRLCDAFVSSKARALCSDN